MQSKKCFASDKDGWCVGVAKWLKMHLAIYNVLCVMNKHFGYIYVVYTSETPKHAAEYFIMATIWGIFEEIKHILFIVALCLQT